MREKNINAFSATLHNKETNEHTEIRGLRSILFNAQSEIPYDGQLKR